MSDYLEFLAFLILFAGIPAVILEAIRRSPVGRGNRGLGAVCLLIWIIMVAWGTPFVYFAVVIRLVGFDGIGRPDLAPTHLPWLALWIFLVVGSLWKILRMMRKPSAIDQLHGLGVPRRSDVPH